MPTIDRLWIRTLFIIAILIFCALLFAPNVLPQKLVVAFHKASPVKSIDDKEVVITPQIIQDFIQDRENGLLLLFPDTKCEPKAGDELTKEYRCVLTDRFITSARINELVQTYPNLIDQRLTRILPHPIEEFFSNFQAKDKGHKNLKIKLGLDLQGGMRAIFRADFDTYLERLKEKLLPYIDKLKKNLEKEKDLTRQREIEAEISSLEYRLILNENQRLILLDSAKEVINKRLASQKLTEPEVRVQEESYSVAVDMPGVANASETLAYIKDTVTVEYRIVNDDATAKVASITENQADLRKIQDVYRRKTYNPIEIQNIMNNIIERSKIDKKDGRIFVYWRRGRNQLTSKLLPREFRVLGPPLIDGSEMENAWSGRNPNSPWYQIYFRLSDTGSSKFGDVTKENVGKRMAILWGDRVVSDPVLREAIYGGNGVISGQFSEKEAREISNVIQEGALPIPLELVSVSSVGPTLGRTSINIGITSILIGYAIVVLFMIGYYRICGLVAVITLFFNLLVMMAIMSLLEFTFTLPGIAGVILTVGMAVDANVIIFEKIKEELRSQKAPALAIENGFKASLWTIIDANITTLIAAIILWLPRNGPIMGFAIVLFFGLLTSMFTALYVSRSFLNWIVYFFPTKRLSIGYGLHEEQVS